MTQDTTKGGASASPRFLVRWNRSADGPVTSLYVEDRLTGQKLTLERRDMAFHTVLMEAWDAEAAGRWDADEGMDDDRKLPLGRFVVYAARADGWLSTSLTDDGDDPERIPEPDEVQDEGA